MEKLIKQKAEEEYVNPEMAEGEKQKGNEFFKKGDYGSAVKHYSEAIRHVTYLEDQFSSDLQGGSAPRVLYSVAINLTVPPACGPLLQLATAQAGQGNSPN